MFVNHAVELLSEIETDLLQIEEEGDDVDSELINKVFRAVHTIKGESGFVALDNIGHLAHSTENVLDLMREHKITPTHETIEALLRSFDALSAMVEDVDNSHDVDVTPHITWLNHLASGSDKPQTSEPEHDEILDGPSNTDRPAPKPSNRKKRTCVLAVDDDPSILELVGHHLNEAGVKCDTAESAEEAITLMLRNYYLVVICDINLPGMSGVEMIPALRTISPLVQTIMLTSEDSAAHVIESLERGAVDFLSKTQGLDNIVRLVTDALERSKRWAPLMTGRL
jgi:two-component system chemotaxis sensor kinase CheA